MRRLRPRILRLLTFIMVVSPYARCHLYFEVLKVVFFWCWMVVGHCVLRVVLLLCGECYVSCGEIRASAVLHNVFLNIRTILVGQQCGRCILLHPTRCSRSPRDNARYFMVQQHVWCKRWWYKCTYLCTKNFVLVFIYGFMLLVCMTHVCASARGQLFAIPVFSCCRHPLCSPPLAIVGC